jgi:hypothetical protein
MKTIVDPTDPREDIDDLVDAPDVDEEVDAPHAGLGAVGQLAVALVVVAVLIMVFIGASAVLRRVFG